MQRRSGRVQQQVGYRSMKVAGWEMSANGSREAIQRSPARRGPNPANRRREMAVTREKGLQSLPIAYVKMRWTKRAMSMPMFDLGANLVEDTTKMEAVKKKVGHLWSEILTCVSMAENNEDCLDDFMKLIDSFKQNLLSRGNVQASADKGKQMKATCGFFSWVDDVNDIQDMQFQILEKDTTIADLENEVKMLKEENENLEELSAEVGIQCNERRLMMECEVDDKRKNYALLLSWVFFFANMF
ncbi:Myosin-2 heavy chain [Bienertia sinuspersici]